MRDPNAQSFPFLTRDMLSYEEGTAFELEVVTSSQYATATLNVTGTTREGPFVFGMTPAGSGLETFLRRIPDLPIFLTAHVSSTNVINGDLWVAMYLRVGGVRIHKLASGYVSTLCALSWPTPVTPSESNNQSPIVGLGSGSAAAGSEISVTVPAGQMWLVRSVVLSLVTDANAANRRVHLLFEIAGGQDIARTFSLIDQVANTTISYYFQASSTVPDETDNSVIIAPLVPNMLLYAGAIIRTLTTNIQAGDDFGPMLVQGELYQSSI